MSHLRYGALACALLLAACGSDDDDGSAVAPGDGDAPDPATATIRDDNAPALLREVVSLVNADLPLALEDELVARAEAVSRALIGDELGETGTAGADAFGLVRTARPDPADANRFLYACANGGTLDVTLEPDVPAYDLDHDGCAIDGDELDGRYAYFGAGREGTRSEYEGVRVARADGTSFEIDGTRATAFDRVGVLASRTLSDMRLATSDGAGETLVTGYASSSSTNPGHLPGSSPAEGYTMSAEASSSFDVVAPWTDGATLSVAASLGVEVEVPGDASEAERDAVSTQWRTGAVEVTAEDGSRARLVPIEGDPERAELFVGESTEPAIVRWDDGYQVVCFGAREELDGCR